MRMSGACCPFGQTALQGVGQVIRQSECIALHDMAWHELGLFQQKAIALSRKDTGLDSRDMSHHDHDRDLQPAVPPGMDGLLRCRRGCCLLGVTSREPPHLTSLWRTGGHPPCAGDEPVGMEPPAPPSAGRQPCK